jgi:DNA-binding MarR family transcriptional regulator
MTSRLKVKKDRALAAYAEFEGATAKLNLLLDNQLRGFGLTEGQFRILETLLQAGPMSQAEIGQRISRHDSDIHVVAANLERRGLIARRAHDTDRRKVSVHLTPEGRKLITKFLPHRAKLVRAQMAVLSCRALETLRRLCRKLAEGDPVKFVLEMTRADADEE